MDIWLGFLISRAMGYQQASGYEFITIEYVLEMIL